MVYKNSFISFNWFYAYYGWRSNRIFRLYKWREKNSCNQVKLIRIKTLNSNNLRFKIIHRSNNYSCPICKIENSSILPTRTEKSQQDSAEAKELASQIQFKVIYQKNFQTVLS